MMANNQKKVTLDFVELRMRIDKRDVLRGVSGRAEPGQLLAIMGPSGAGKTLLLTCLAGRQRALESGHILLNGQPLTKRLRRQISFVMQEDLFLSELTLSETLKFTADLRLPGHMSAEDKRLKIQNIVDTLDLNKCLDTKIGNDLNRGLSGGEKKRANVACELLTDPSILLLDEPTSGLDSRTACDLLETLKEYAIISGKTVITSIHQPSSRVFQLFDSLLLLSEGQVVYFGETSEVVNYFAQLGLQCPKHYNPADYIIDIVKGNKEERTKVNIGAKNQLWDHHFVGKTLPSHISIPIESVTVTESDGIQGSINHALSVGSLQDGSFDDSVFINSGADEADDVCKHSPGYVSTLIHSSNTNVNASHHQFVRAAFNTSLATELHVQTLKGSQHFEADPYDDALLTEEKWPTGFWNQMVTLTHRNFKQNRYLVLSKLDIFKQIATALLVSVLWFQIEIREENIRDVSGMIFFMSAYWGFESIYSSLTTFQLERAIMAKERLAGAYRLSAFFMSKVIGELPLLTSLALVNATISFWMTGLHTSFVAFLCYLVNTLLYVQAGQAIGRFISAVSSSIQQCITAASLTMLASMLLGGFYHLNLPVYIHWMQYASIASHVYGVHLSAVFVIVPQTVSCDPSVLSPYGDCILPTNASRNMYTNTSALLISASLNSTTSPSTRGTMDGEQIVKALVSFDYPIWGYYLTLAGIMAMFNFLAYLVLRFARKIS